MENEWVDERFEAERPRLRQVAARILGSASEADDAVQEAWLRLHRSDADAIDNLSGWLTTVVSRICLDMLRSRNARPDMPHVSGEVPERADRDADPERDALVADAVGPALLAVLETLSPAERVAFVLHDVFAVSFDEIALVLDRSPAAARQLASRGRRRVQGAPTASADDVARQRAVVEAFLAASRNGDLAGLVALLDPDVVVRADLSAVEYGSEPTTTGADAVAGFFVGRARGARATMVDGAVGLVWSVGGTPRVVFDLVIDDGRILEVDLIADADHLARIDLEPVST